AQVPVVPGRLDALEERRLVALAVPPHTEPVAVRRLDAEPRVEALVDQGVLGLVEQVVEKHRRPRVCEPAAHRLLLVSVGGRAPVRSPQEAERALRFCATEACRLNRELRGPPHGSIWAVAGTGGAEICRLRRPVDGLTRDREVLADD